MWNKCQLCGEGGGRWGSQCWIRRFLCEIKNKCQLFVCAVWVSMCLWGERGQVSYAWIKLFKLSLCIVFFWILLTVPKQFFCCTSTLLDWVCQIKKCAILCSSLCSFFCFQHFGRLWFYCGFSSVYSFTLQLFLIKYLNGNNCILIITVQKCALGEEGPITNNGVHPY